MRIALIGPTHPYKGGISLHTTELAHRLAARGHDVRLVSWSAQYPRRLYPGELRVAEAESEPYPATAYPLGWHRPDSWWRVGRRLRGTADVVVVVLATPLQVPAYAVLLRAARGVRSVAVCHNVVPHEPRRGDAALVGALLRRVGAVVVHSAEEARVAAALTGAEVGVAALAPHLPAAPPAAGTDWSGPSRRLVFFGLVRPYKGLDDLLAALALTPPDVRLTVAGEFWGGVEAVAATVRRLGLRDRVELRPGYLPAAALPGLLAGADALVLPYRSATSSQQPALAAAYGLPVIATRVGTFPAQVRDGVDGLLCAPGDPAALATAVSRLYEPGMLARLRAGVRPADADASWAAYLDVVERAVGAGSLGR